MNVSFLELIRSYPLGNGLGGGGTSVPYFLQDRIRNVVVMENEYARILLELGIPGLLMWLLFIGWVFTRGEIKKSDMFYFGRRLAFVAVACTFATGLIGTGLFTSVPSTAIVLLLTGWIVVPALRAAHIGHATAKPPVIPDELCGPYEPSFTSMISSAIDPWASRCTAAAASLLGAWHRQKTLPVPSSYQYRM